MNDIFGHALFDFYIKATRSKLWIHNKYGPKEEMPIPTYFRPLAKMPELEAIALQNCKGRVLDIGAGAGSHALALQQKSIDVTPLEISPKAAEVMRLRGVAAIVKADIFEFEERGFDTLLMLMNGIGLTATIGGLRNFLQHAKKLLNADGQLIFDSSDVAYLYEGNLPKTGHYYGEISYRYEYKKQKTEWFTWLYIDKKRLIQTAREEGWETKILYEDNFDQYLARLILKN